MQLKIMEMQGIYELPVCKPDQDKTVHDGSVKHTRRISQGPNDFITKPFEELGDHSGSSEWLVN